MLSDNLVIVWLAVNASTRRLSWRMGRVNRKFPVKTDCQNFTSTLSILPVLFIKAPRENASLTQVEASVRSFFYASREIDTSNLVNEYRYEGEGQ